MSTSEKLRALVEPGWGMSAHSERRLCLALPEIVALVEAAEAEHRGSAATRGSPCPICLALAALDAKMTPRETA